MMYQSLKIFAIIFFRGFLSAMVANKLATCYVEMWNVSAPKITASDLGSRWEYGTQLWRE